MAGGRRSHASRLYETRLATVAEVDHQINTDGPPCAAHSGDVRISRISKAKTCKKQMKDTIQVGSRNESQNKDFYEFFNWYFYKTDLEQCEEYNLPDALEPS